MSIEIVEEVREQLLAMVRMEREMTHLQSALEHVTTISAVVQGGESTKVSCRVVRSVLSCL